MKQNILCVLLLLTSAFALDNGLARTPPMGWSTWNKFRCNINETLMKDVAKAFLDNGMKEAGYEYINIDDCWSMKKRDASGHLVADPIKFPGGMKKLTDYIHSIGLKAGIYGALGVETCQRYPGSYGYYEVDAQTFSDWGFDYVKYDWCVTKLGEDPRVEYPLMSKALNKTKPMVYSMCEYGWFDPWKWGASAGNLWRTTGDIADNWLRWNRILDEQVGLSRYAGPGAWNDPDMLEVGNGGQTNAEYRAHFSFWCLLSAPLIAGNDILTMDEETSIILTNKEAIDVNQDPAGIQGDLVWRSGDLQIWSKQLSSGDVAVILFNKERGPNEITIRFGDVHLGTRVLVRDLWKHKNLGVFEDSFTGAVPGHSVLFVRLRDDEQEK